MKETTSTPPEKLDAFQLQLVDALKTVRNDFNAKMETAVNALQSAETSSKHAITDANDVFKIAENTHDAYQVLKAVNINCSRASLLGKNTLALANIAVTDANTTNQSIAAAAKAIDQAAESAARLASDVASIYAKLNSEDSRSKMETFCKTVSELTRKSAIATEKTTLTILDAAIQAAQTKTDAALSLVKTVSADVDALAKAIDTTTSAAQAAALTAYTDYITATGTQYTDLLSVSQSQADSSTYTKLINEIVKQEFAIVPPETAAQKKAAEAPAPAANPTPAAADPKGAAGAKPSSTSPVTSIA